MLSKYTAGEKLLLATALVSVLHHIDHILRIDHSGWPFVPRISPFTFSLLAYPILISIFWANRYAWYRVWATALLFSFATAAHIFFEPLSDKYHTWTYGSNLVGHTNETNMLGVHSAIIGIASVTIAVLLSVILLITLVAFIKEARRPMLKNKG